LFRYKLIVSYNGKHYAGWQVQPNAVTVQEKLESALEVLAKQKVRVQASGRTDAGVHARNQPVHVDLTDPIDCKKYLRSLNGLLPTDIVVKSISPADPRFHARFDANYRTYHYYFSSQFQPLHTDTTTVWWYPLDITRMNEAAALIIGDIDCSSFTPYDEKLPHHRCYFFEARILGPDLDQRYCFEITANRFLRSVVRSLMGSLLLVGRGKMTVEAFRALLQHPNREAAGPTAPPTGLVLHQVGYDVRWRLPGDLKG